MNVDTYNSIPGDKPLFYKGSWRELMHIGGLTYVVFEELAPGGIEDFYGAKGRLIPYSQLDEMTGEAK